MVHLWSAFGVLGIGYWIIYIYIDSAGTCWGSFSNSISILSPVLALVSCLVGQQNVLFGYGAYVHWLPICDISVTVRCFKLQQLHAFISILVDLCTQTRLELGMEIWASQDIHGDPWRSHVGHLNLTESSTASMVAERDKPKPVRSEVWEALWWPFDCLICIWTAQTMPGLPDLSPRTTYQRHQQWWKCASICALEVTRPPPDSRENRDARFLILMLMTFTKDNCLRTSCETLRSGLALWCANHRHASRRGAAIPGRCESYAKAMAETFA